jgi:hypothetical protein
LATSVANAAKARAPDALAFTLWPAKKSAPPVETWMMPSDCASLNPCSTASTVDEDDTLIAG